MCFVCCVVSCASKKTKEAEKHVRTLRFFFRIHCAALVSWALLSHPVQAADELPASPGTEVRPDQVLLFAPTNQAMLTDVLARPSKELTSARGNVNVARFIALLLEQQHYRQQSLDDSVSNKFLERYLEVLDNLHMHFLQIDIQQFGSYRTNLDELTERKGDVTPAYVIFSRFLQRVEQRVAFVADLLAHEKFEFKGDDRYNLDRRKSPRPKDLEDAKQLWRQHLRYEILQEKLNNEKPAEIANKITRRYTRLLRTLKDYDSDDIFEIYLSSLAHTYDPHSDYMGKSAYDSFNIGMKLSLFGIGALLQSEDGYCKVRSLVPNGPAAKSKKIKENDQIIAVAQGDAEPVEVIEMKLNKVVDMIRGAKGTEVRLTIIPADAHDPSVRKVVSLIRDEVKLEDQEAKAKIIDLPSTSEKISRVGVIDLPSFYADFEKKSGAEGRKSTTRDVSLLLRKLKQEKIDGLILDLRRNGGGSLEEAINLTGLFIKQGPVVQVKDPHDKIIVDDDTDPTVLYDGPLIVLTSRFSASASEILAGALQDYGRALVVGDSSTHGKGTVQSVIQLDRHLPSNDSSNPGALKVTIRKFYRASGSSTQLKGVTPDIILPSINNHAEVGEASLDNALPWDTIPSAKYENLNRVQPLLPELQKRSAKRIESDQDFAYLKEDIEQFKKSMADRTVSLNEEQRLKEKQEAEAKKKIRIAELKARPEENEKIYELTLALAQKDGLPEPLSKDAKENKDADPSDPAEKEEENASDTKVPSVDFTLKEAKHILLDLVALSNSATAIAASTESKKPNPVPGAAVTDR